MRCHRGGTAALLLAAACLVLGGCSEGAERPAVDEAGSVEAAEEITAHETTHAPLLFREFELPAGGGVEGYDERTACLLEPESVESGLSAIRLLDLQSGEHQLVVPRAVGVADGFDILSARCSDEWLVWEEIGGDEQGQPLDVQWRLYALPVDGCEVAGEPTLVAGTVTSAQSRPLYSVCDETLCWMTNSFANARQEGAVDAARVWSRALPDGEERLLYKTGADAFSFSAQPGELLLTEAVERNADEGKLVVLEPGTGAVREEIPLNNESWLSHFTAYKDGMSAWAEGNEQGGAGRFFFRDAEGEANLISIVSNDAVFVGDYLFYESKPYVSKGVGAHVQHWRVCALDTRTLDYFTVFDEEAQGFGWSAPLAVAPRSSEYVMCRSVPPWITEEPPGTWVRVYTLP
ncbi:MAG: hypothetical protein Q7J82_10750 [Coriobacteriia bacterium]|nr:hypothetical protein [Coriobacteriia bacterium]